MIVAVWNMAKRPAAWGHLLDSLAPDLALLQETPPPPDQSGVAQLLHDRDYASNSLGSAIYLRDGAARPLPLHPGPPRLVHGRRGRASRHPATRGCRRSHPDRAERPPVCRRGIRAVAPLLEGRSFVVGGDFNLSRNYDKVYGTTHTPSSSMASQPGASSTACARPRARSSGPSGVEPSTPTRTTTCS